MTSPRYYQEVMDRIANHERHGQWLAVMPFQTKNNGEVKVLCLVQPESVGEGAAIIPLLIFFDNDFQADQFLDARASLGDNFKAATKASSFAEIDANLGVERPVGKRVEC